MAPIGAAVPACRPEQVWRTGVMLSLKMDHFAFLFKLQGDAQDIEPSPVFLKNFRARRSISPEDGCQKIRNTGGYLLPRPVEYPSHANTGTVDADGYLKIDRLFR